MMKKVLDSKKTMVLKQLINQMGYRNTNNMEASLNASSVLIELIEMEKTFELFWQDDAEIINSIVELAIDPLNSFNQQYLLHVLVAICKQLKPQSTAQNAFKNLDEDDEEAQ